VTELNCIDFGANFLMFISKRPIIEICASFGSKAYVKPNWVKIEKINAETAVSK
jgi:hypothetical protein